MTMQIVATYTDPEEAQETLWEIQKQFIPHEVKKVDDNGLEVTEIHVPEDRFDAACAIVEDLLRKRTEAAQRSSRRRCPDCGSPDLVQRSDVDCSRTVTGITYVLQCRNCGRAIPV